MTNEERTNLEHRCRVAPRWAAEEIERLRSIEENSIRILTSGCKEHTPLTFDAFQKAGGTGCAICLTERNQMLSDIARSAVALSVNIEHGFTPTFAALNRDLAAFNLRFGQHPMPRSGEGR